MVMANDIAANYYSHFFFAARAGQLQLKLSEHAPDGLKVLVDKVCGMNPSQERLSCLYECLCNLAGADALVAPDSCTEDLYPKVSAFLARSAD